MGELLTLEEAQKKIAELEGELNTAITNLEAKQNELASALETNATLTKIIEMAPAAPKEQTTEIDASKVNLADFSFEFKKKKYGFNFYKMSLDGVTITAEEIAVDDKLQAKVVAMNSGIIKEL